ncbi:endonuclease III domain-containing protein [Sulfurimonas sp. MAG313]|nr:endonuclease III domain-containing protein [Sulfurimonas sp. MAG313]MDF1879962.1 endonuclease III domain-containing protein [Sulfurimonas sp. MAG313]
MSVYQIYIRLHEEYGPQGWWPFINYKGENTAKFGNHNGYHKKDYSFPRNSLEIFEVCLGSILTQNTSFTSVVKSLHNLNNKDALSPQGIKEMPIEELKVCIKPSGYHNQKAKYILEFISFYEGLQGCIPSRESLLKVLGIGEETADSILLFAYKQTEFKIDSYTKRILIDLDFLNEKAKYKDIKKCMQDALEGCYKDKEEQLVLYQEFHALLVNHAKEFYSKKPYGEGSFLRKLKN